MNKQDLLKSIAESGYNIGFGAEKHYVTYEMYTFLPKVINFAILSVGIIQLTSWYKKCFNNDMQDILSASIIILGILALMIDMASKNKDNIDIAGKELCDLFNKLRCMYYEIVGLEEHSNLKPYIDKLSEINDRAKQVSISDQAFFSNTVANLTFFGGGKQIGWINEVRPFKKTDKFAFLHPESFILYIAISIGIVIFVKWLISLLAIIIHSLYC